MNVNPISPLAIRRAEEADNPGIRKVQVATWKSTYRGMIPDVILDQMTTDGPPGNPRPPVNAITNSRRVFVAVNGANEVFGFAMGGLSRRSDWNYECELWAIYVLPSEQGKGLGRKLFQALVAELATEYTSMIIWSLEANHKSHRFYESRGGKRLALTKQFKWNDQPVATEVAYGWETMPAMVKV